LSALTHRVVEVNLHLVPREVLGLRFYHNFPPEDRFLQWIRLNSRPSATLLGGQSAEETVFGSITTGASNDLQRATDLAEADGNDHGMSKVLGPWLTTRRQACFWGMKQPIPATWLANKPLKPLTAK